jgi:pSer/pThr/pTyr-binding forkhead associated (FHA) protein
MTEFVKICPQCGQANPEYEHLCGQCNHFIGLEAAQPAVQNPPVQAVTPAELRGGLLLTLPGTTLSFPVRSGDTLGQSHPDSDAQIQLPPSVTDVAYIHRRHCRFQQAADQWLLEAIDQGPLGREFTNPTWVNGVRLEPGERCPLGHGDDLRLSGTTLLVQLRGDTAA